MPLRFLVTVEAITRIRDETVDINQTRQHIAGAPPYAPDLIHQDAGKEGYDGDGYQHYGYPPYWDPGYIYPPFPSYP